MQEIRDSSDEKSGLQEFYDALERIIADIKGMQDHAAPFLNRVKKSEAPNYYDSMLSTSCIHIESRLSAHQSLWF